MVMKTDCIPNKVAVITARKVTIQWDWYRHDIFQHTLYALNALENMTPLQLRRDDLRQKTKNQCSFCGNIIQRYWDSRYNGVRGKCDFCDSNWPESWVIYESLVMFTIDRQSYYLLFLVTLSSVIHGYYDKISTHLLCRNSNYRTRYEWITWIVMNTSLHLICHFSS